MAEPLFDDHPLEEYFRQTGETAEDMPGGSPDFAVEWDGVGSQLPAFVNTLIEIAHSFMNSSHSSSSENAFAERFKYDVISSSLLSTSIAAPTSTMRRTFFPEKRIPGKLDDEDSGGEDPDPDGERIHYTVARSDRHLLAAAPVSTIFDPHFSLVLASFAMVALATSNYFLAMVVGAAAAYTRYFSGHDHDEVDSTAHTLDALNELISAGNVWDSAVNEAIMLIENEERSIFYGPTSAQAPSSALRMALQSSLYTTQSQCDNVRQLLSALTSHATLSQLAEMYAPPSPVRHTISLVDNARASTVRPISDPVWRQRTTLQIGDPSPANKRATWNGSYAALANAGSPTSRVFQRKQQNRRSDVTSLFQPQLLSSSASAPVSPHARLKLDDVTEDGEDDHPASELDSKEYFGAAAMDLRRKRQSMGLDALGIPQPTHPTAHRVSPPIPEKPTSLFSPTISSSSRLTSVHTTRHPLSLSGLHLALQGALSAKRYTCSHLLALRFSEDEEESYWEDVRSVMALLTTTFADTSARLVEALDESDKRRIKDEHPSPDPFQQLRHRKRESSISSLRHESTPPPTDRRRSRRMDEMVSFAPMPSHLARLGTHVDAISSALNDARDHLNECVAALQTPPSSRRSSSSLDNAHSTPSSLQEHPAFQAYDRLRKELGYALRECERGRERLLDILGGPRRAPAEDDASSPDTPALKHDSGTASEGSEKFGPSSPAVLQHEDEDARGLGLELDAREFDDASAHLLLGTTAQHLPPAGIEQVYEAETGAVGAFARERSKLSREERIKLAKARRESGEGHVRALSTPGAGDVKSTPGIGNWGPGGEVVQELKDVIWKVGERKRKLTEQGRRVSGDTAPPEDEPEVKIALPTLVATPADEDVDEDVDTELAYLS